MLLSLMALSSRAAASTPPTPYVHLEGSPLLAMPSVNLGTCCGSEPSVGLPAWLAAGGVGIDTAYEYYDQVTTHRGECVLTDPVLYPLQSLPAEG